MIRFHHPARVTFAVILSLLSLVLVGCSTGSTSTAGPANGSTPGATTPPSATATQSSSTTNASCGTSPTGTALVWADGQQVFGLVPQSSATPVQLSNFTYPLGIPDEGAVGNSPFVSFSAVAPDAKHLAVAITQIVPFMAEYDPYIVDLSTHAVTRVMIPSPIKVASGMFPPPRIFAWANTHTLVLFTGQQAETYDISTKALTPLPGTAGAFEGVVRCSTLFYLTFPNLNAQTHPIVPEYVNQYSLTTHAAVNAPLDIGSAGTWGGAEGEILYGGWDASPDGSKVVFQGLGLTGNAQGVNVTGSHWSVVASTGGPASGILPGATANTSAEMTISPDGTQVAVANANPSPNVVSGPLSGGPARFYDSPAAYTYPAWRADSQAFFSGIGNDYTGPSFVGRYTLGAAAHATGTTPYTSANFPASLP